LEHFRDVRRAFRQDLKTGLRLEKALETGAVTRRATSRIERLYARDPRHAPRPLTSQRSPGVPSQPVDRGDGLSHADKHDIAGLMAITVVDALEMIDVDHDEGVTFPRRAWKGCKETLPVWYSGQGIRICQMSQLCFGSFLEPPMNTFE